MAGPAPGRTASPTMAVPVVAKIPAPMVAPTPSAVRCHLLSRRRGPPRSGPLAPLSVPAAATTGAGGVALAVSAGAGGGSTRGVTIGGAVRATTGGRRSRTGGGAGLGAAGREIYATPCSLPPPPPP